MSNFLKPNTANSRRMFSISRQIRYFIFFWERGMAGCSSNATAFYSSSLYLIKQLICYISVMKFFGGIEYQCFLGLVTKKWLIFNILFNILFYEFNYIQPVGLGLKSLTVSYTLHTLKSMVTSCQRRVRLMAQSRILIVGHSIRPHPKTYAYFCIFF